MNQCRALNLPHTYFVTADKSRILSSTIRNTHFHINNIRKIFKNRNISYFIELELCYIEKYGYWFRILSTVLQSYVLSYFNKLKMSIYILVLR